MHCVQKSRVVTASRTFVRQPPMFPPCEFVVGHIKSFSWTFISLLRMDVLPPRFHPGFCRFLIRLFSWQWKDPSMTPEIAPLEGGADTLAI